MVDRSVFNRYFARVRYIDKHGTERFEPMYITTYSYASAKGEVKSKYWQYRSTLEILELRAFEEQS